MKGKIKQTDYSDTTKSNASKGQHHSKNIFQIK